MTGECILVVDDHATIIDLARLYLEREGYRVEAASDGAQALEKVDALQPAVMILDLMLPEVDGYEVCRRVRLHSDLPILMLTARDDDVDKIVGLELGADNYRTKPFNPRELVARVRAILRRSQPTARSSDQPLHVGDLTIDPARRETTVGGRPVTLRAKEFDLLLALAHPKNAPAPRPPRAKSWAGGGGGWRRGPGGGERGGGEKKGGLAPGGPEAFCPGR